MNKRMKILVGTVVGAMLLLGVATTAFADDTPTPSTPDNWWQEMWQWCGGGGPGPAGSAFIGGGVATQVAKLLGMTPQDLLNERNSGKSIFQIAQAKGVSQQQVLDAAMAPYKDALALRVKYGSIDQQQADQLAQQQQQYLQNLFNATDTTNTPSSFNPGAGGFGRGMMGGYGGGYGMMGGFGGYGGGYGMMGGWY